MNKERLTQVQKNIQEAINNGKVQMRSKKYFIARSALLIVSTIIIALALIYLISFGFFVLQASGVLELSGFGLRGLVPFLVSLPWLLFAITLVFIIGLEFLVKKTTVAYRKPLVYSVLGVVVLVFIAGFAFAQLPLHENIYNRSFEKNPPPVVGEFYKQFGQHPLHNVYPGIILELNDNGFLMSTVRDEIRAVIITEETIFIDGQELKIYDPVMVMGEIDDESIEADAIKIRRMGDMMGPRGNMPGPPRN